MIRFILALIFFGATVALALGVLPKFETRKVPLLTAEGHPLRNRYDEPAYREDEVKVPVRWPALITAVLGVFLLLWSCTRVLKSTEVGVPVTLGRAGTPLDSGFHFVAPWTDVVRFSTTIQSRDIEVNAGGSDGGTAVVATTVRYAIEIGGENCSVVDLFRRVKSEDKLESLVVERETNDAFRLKFNSRPAFVGLTTDMPDVTDEVSRELGKRFSTQCVRLDRFLITGMTPSPKVQDAIDASIAAEQKVNQAKQDALAAKATADGEANAAIAAAKGRKEAAEADAQANRTLAASLTPEVLQAKMIEAIGANDNVIVVPADATPMIQVSPG